MENVAEFFLTCKKCGKKLIARRSDGIFHFKFGRRVEDSCETDFQPPVELWIVGSIRMRCIRRTCRYVNEFSFFPSKEDQSEFEAVSQSEANVSP